MKAKDIDQICKLAEEWIENVEFEEDFDIKFDDVFVKFVTDVNAIIERCINGSTLFNTYLLFYDILYDFFSEKFGQTFKQKKGNFRDFLSLNEKRKLISCCRDFFSSLPRKYKVYVELPDSNLQNVRQIEICDQIKIGRFGDEISSSDPNLLLALSGQKSEAPPKIYLCFMVEGFANSYEYCPATLEIQRYIREIFTALFVFDFVAFSPITTASTIKHDVQVVENPSTDKLIKLPLPSDLSRGLSRVTFSSSLFEKALFTDSAQAAKANLYPITQCFSTNDKEIERIKTSLEWLGFSLMNENDTFAFIQATTSLEALLGEKNSEVGLMEIIGDRCAFLLEKTTEKRVALKKAFKEIYEIRSSIIHGRKRTLDHEQRKRKSELINLAKRAIRQEISNYSSSKFINSLRRPS